MDKTKIRTIQPRNKNGISRNKSHHNTEWIQSLPLLTIDRIVKNGRIRNHMSKTELALKTGLSPTMIYRLESGQTKKPSKDVLRVLAPYTGISYTKLLVIAGYGDVYGQEVYYSKSGTMIPSQEAIADIYAADADLLETMLGLNILPVTDIQLIITFITLLKQSANTGGNLATLMDTAKSTLSSQLKLINSLVSESS